MKLHEAAEQISSREALIKFISLLRNDLKENKCDWENDNLENYFEAMQAWIEDMDGYYKNKGIPLPFDNPWQLLADILHAARIYE